MNIGVFFNGFSVEQIDRSTVRAWCRAVDEGPFASLSYGERTVWSTIDHYAMLTAAAVLTERVEIWSYVLNLPRHPTRLAAKRTASVDTLSGGRYTMAVGIGGPNRDEDWRAAEKPPIRFPHAQLDEQIAEVRRIWSGAASDEGYGPIGPTPIQPGGPRIMCSAHGPKGLARAARWADGFADYVSTKQRSDGGHDFGHTIARVRDGWREAGRQTEPYLSTSVLFALGPEAQREMRNVVDPYMVPVGSPPGHDVEAVSGDDEVRRLIEDARRDGFDHLVFQATSYDVAEVERLAALVEAS